jgi:transcriptional antiterminator RfaH
MFPAYLFARFDWKKSLDLVRHTYGVAGVVHFGSFWPRVPDHVVEDLRELIGEEGIRLIEPSIAMGDEVEVAAGAFGGFRGIVARVMPARDRVAVLLEFLGRQSTVELPIGEVEKVDSEPALALA